MSLDRLLVECTLHYRDRGFPESALMHLRWVLITNTHDGQIRLQTAYHRCNKRVEELIGHFGRCLRYSDQGDLASAQAVFGFAYGYRMKQWPSASASTDATESAANRIPGTNNAVL